MALRIFYIMFAIFVLHYQTVRAEAARDLIFKGVEEAQKSNFPKAMSYFTKSMKQAETDHDTVALMASIGYIGNMYYNIYDYTRCLQYQLKGYKMAVESGNNDVQCNFLTNIVGAYCKMKDTKNAWYYYQLLEQAVPHEDVFTYYYFLFYDRARIATAEDKPHEALQYHRKALEWATRKQMNTIYKLFQYCEIGQIYLLEGQCDSTISYGQRCIEPARQAAELDLLTSVYKMMADAYSKKGDTVKAQGYQQQYLALSDSLFNRNKIFPIDSELVKYEAQKTNTHIDKLNRVISRQTFSLVAISFIAVLLMALGFILFFYNRKLKMAHSALIGKNIEIQSVETSREKILQRWIDNDKEADETEKSSNGLDDSQTKMLLQRIIKTMSEPETIANPDFSLQMLADAVGSNTKYVSTVINDTYGKNFKTLLNEYRIRQACLRLSDTAHYGQMTIQAIYEEVGYTNAVSFNRAFKKINGMTPSEYQRAAIDKKQSQDDADDK